MGDFIDNSDVFLNEFDKKAESVLTEIGIHLTTESQDELENDPRRIDTGNLRNSISNRYVGDEKAVYIGTNVEYGVYVHEGTVKMSPNKFLRNAVERNLDQIQDLIKNELKK